MNKNNISKNSTTNLNEKSLFTINKEISFLLINVLDKEDFDDCHIKNSINVPFSHINSFFDYLEKENYDKEKKIIFYCSNYFCTASDEAAEIATKKGFSDVYVYKGGTAEWYQKSQKDSSFLYEGLAQHPYLKIIILKPDLNSSHHSFSFLSAEELQSIINK